jgi:hypothetical protein
VPKLDRSRVVPLRNLPQNRRMECATEIKRSATRSDAIELITAALRLCDEAGDFGPACHLQLGLDMLMALDRGDDGISPLRDDDSQGIDSKSG